MKIKDEEGKYHDCSVTKEIGLIHTSYGPMKISLILRKLEVPGNTFKISFTDIELSQASGWKQKTSKGNHHADCDFLTCRLSGVRICAATAVIPNGSVPKFSDRYNWANSADLLEEQSDQGLHCLQFPLHLLDALLYSKSTLFKF